MDRKIYWAIIVWMLVVQAIYYVIQALRYVPKFLPDLFGGN